MACIARTCVKLEHLDVRGVEQVDDNAMSACSQMPNLRSLNITGCAGVSEEGFALFESEKCVRSCTVVGSIAEGRLCNSKVEEGKRN